MKTVPAIAFVGWTCALLPAPSSALTCPKRIYSFDIAPPTVTAVVVRAVPERRPWKVEAITLDEGTRYTVWVDTLRQKPGKADCGWKPSAISVSGKLPSGAAAEGVLRDPEDFDEVEGEFETFRSRSPLVLNAVPPDK